MLGVLSGNSRTMEHMERRSGKEKQDGGTISQYDTFDSVQGPKLYLGLAERKPSMSGFEVSHQGARFRDALMMLSSGKHLGNLVVRA